MVFCARMGTQVPRALISTLLIAGVFYAPFAPLAHADEQVASSTEATTASTTVSAVVATTTQEEVDAEATTTAQVPATVPDPGPSFVEAIVSHPNHVLRASNFSEQQTALKDGDVVDIAAVVTGAVPASSVTVDATGLDGSTVLNLLCDPSYTNTNYPQPLQYCRGRTVTINTGGRIGTTSVTFTATDEAGLTVTKSVDIVLDQLSPVFSNPTLTRTSTSTFSRDETLHFSGTLNGTGSGAKIYSILGEGLAADGNSILYGSYYNWNHPLLSDVYAIRAGTFSNVSLPLSGAYSGADIPSDVASMRFVFTIEDDAGHVSYATSTVSATSTTPSGPQVSNVLFLPGIKGSRLYDTDGNKLWEPSTDEDVQKLYLDSSGKSLTPSVHAKSGDIIGLISGFLEVYGSFIHEMNALQNEGEIKEWRIASYDWRLSLDDIVNKGVVRDDNIYYDETADVPYLERNLHELASSSPTGKVTIIAHSNGGLVAKKLMMKLGDAETARLVDKVVFVGVPQSGAPQALGALLYGYKEALPWFFPFMVSRATARTFAENSPMAYHLLPSQRYFDDVLDKDHAVVQFNAEQSYETERNSYGNVINSWSELRSFSLAEEGGRTKPNPLNYASANVLNENLLTYAKNAHDQIDTWTPPSSVTLYQIGGWGQDTVSGIEFYELCVLSICKKEYRPTFIEDGDGVVPIPSSLMTSTTTENVKRYWINLSLYGYGPLGNKDHGNLLSIIDLQNFIATVLVDNPSTEIQQNIFIQQPDSKKLEKRLRFILHSPLTLNLYDSSGNHAGPNLSNEPDENIPGSQYGEFGEVQYLIVPAGPEYNLRLEGYAGGAFSLDIQEVSGEGIIASTTFANIPSQTGTIVQANIKDSIKTLSPLSVDSNGDGSADFSVPVTENSVSYYEVPTSNPNSSETHSRNSTSILNSSLPVEAIKDFLPSHEISPVFEGRVIPVVMGSKQIEPASTSATIHSEGAPGVDAELLVASPLSAFVAIKDKLISILIEVYYFLMKIIGITNLR